MTEQILTLYLYVCLAFTGICRVHCGKKFVFNYMENGNLFGTPFGKVTLINTSPGVAAVNVSTPLITSGPDSVQQYLSLPAGGVQTLSFSPGLSMSDTQKEDKGILVTSDEHIIVQALNAGKYMSDGYVVPPVDELGVDHVAITYKYAASSAYQGPYSIGVVATEDGTSVTIDLTGPTSVSFTYLATTYSTGGSLVVTLNTYETLQVQVTYGDGGDFSGCRVLSDKAIFVQSGAYYGSVGAHQWPDHLADTLPTIHQLGVLYVVVPFKRRTLGDVVKFQASGSPAVVTVRDSSDTLVHTASLAAYSHDELSITSSEYYSVTADQSIMVAQFLRCYQGEATTNSDPTMVILRPVTEWRSAYTFYTPKDWFSQDYLYNDINIVAPSADRSAILLDAATIAPSWTTLGSSGYSAARVSVSAGLHTLLHPGGVAISVIAYGQKDKDTYGFHAAHTPTDLPTTVAPSSAAPTTVEHSTQAATTMEPSTVEPSTVEPSTVEPSTVEPSAHPVTALQPTTLEPMTLETTTLETTTLETITHSTLGPTSLEPNIISESTVKATSGISIVTTTRGQTTTITEITDCDSTVGDDVSSVGGSSQYSNSTVYTTGGASRLDTVTRESALVTLPSVTSLPRLHGRGLSWGAWFYTTTCSVTCGPGHQVRFRVCINNTESCRTTLPHTLYAKTGYEVDVGQCNLGPCNLAFWLPWSAWGTCGATCGKSVRSRVRECSSTRHPCYGARHQHDICHESYCPRKWNSYHELVLYHPLSLPRLTVADYRASAQGIGGVAIGIITVLVLLIICMDGSRLLRDLQHGVQTPV